MDLFNKPVPNTNYRKKSSFWLLEYKNVMVFMHLRLLIKIHCCIRVTNYASEIMGSSVLNSCRIHKNQSQGFKQVPSF